jgi:flagellar hook-basal body complex protein FliE
MNPSILNVSSQPSAMVSGTEPKPTPAEAQTSFANHLKDAIDDLNQIQTESDKKTEALATGNINNLHDVMVTAQKSSIALETAVQVQRKVIDAYNEVMRMQV